jgi:hypothetical protein
MADESIFMGSTLRERFAAAIGESDETLKQQLKPLIAQEESPKEQRDEAWRFLTAVAGWVADALAAGGVTDSDRSEIRDAEAAFERAQHLDAQLWKLNKQPGQHDQLAFMVEAAKSAYYHGADLGPVQGGGLGSFREPGGAIAITPTVEPRSEDLQAIGSEAGEVLRRYGEFGLGQPAVEALALLRDQQ